MDNESITSGNPENLIPEGFSAEKQTLSPTERSGLKKCPYCAELIQPEAIKCRYCGEFLHGFTHRDVRPRSSKWYFSTPGTVILLLVLGPFVLPAVWMNPRFKVSTKLIVTIVVIIFTVFLIYMLGVIYHQLLKELNQINSLEM